MRSATCLALSGCGLQQAAAADALMPPPPGTVDAALAALAAGTVSGSRRTPDQIRLTLPGLIEDGASVPVSVATTLTDVQEIYVLADMNPMPIAAQFRLGPGVAGQMSVRVKLAGSGRVYGAVRTPEGLYWTTAKADVIVGGCS